MQEENHHSEVRLPNGVQWQPESCWDSIYDAINDCRVLCYVVGAHSMFAVLTICASCDPQLPQFHSALSGCACSALNITEVLWLTCHQTLLHVLFTFVLPTTGTVRVFEFCWHAVALVFCAT